MAKKKHIKSFKQLQEEIKNIKTRDKNIEMHIKGEINLSERKVVNKKKVYNRKKLKKVSYEYKIA